MIYFYGVIAVVQCAAILWMIFDIGRIHGRSKASSAAHKVIMGLCDKHDDNPRRCLDILEVGREVSDAIYKC